jgi:mono/diheme cytochrome c family protein
VTDSPNDRPAADVVDPIEVAKRRKKIPLWVVPLFPALLVWALIYVNGVTTPPAAANTPDSMGAQIYGDKCSGCHGATGGGGSGPAFAGGDLLKVFPKWDEQVHWVDVGSANWTKVTGSETFGETKKPIDANKVMPGFGPDGDSSLTCSEIVLVVRYEREHFAGAEPDTDLDALAEQIAAGETPADIPNCKQ